jgi:hypothetical protein
MRTDAANVYRKKLLRVIPVEKLLVMLERWRWERICTDRMICPRIDDRLMLSLKVHAAEAFEMLLKPAAEEQQQLQSKAAF